MPIFSLLSPDCMLNDVWEYTELNRLIDIKKTFDTLEWQFLDSTLKYLNFGPKLSNWISAMYSVVERDDCFKGDLIIS